MNNRQLAILNFYNNYSNKQTPLTMDGYRSVGGSAEIMTYLTNSSIFPKFFEDIVTKYKIDKVFSEFYIKISNFAMEMFSRTNPETAAIFSPSKIGLILNNLDGQRKMGLVKDLLLTIPR